jgi:hypothetical protein
MWKLEEVQYQVGCKSDINRENQESYTNPAKLWKREVKEIIA